MNFSFAHELQPDGTFQIYAHGKLSVHDCASSFSALDQIFSKINCHNLIFDLHGINYMDSSGIILIAHLRQLCKEKNISFQLLGTNKKIQGLLDLLNMDSLIQAPAIKNDKKAEIKNNVHSFFSVKLEYIGDISLSICSNARFTLTFIGDTLLTLFTSLRHPKSLRISDLLKCLERSGIDAFPIVVLINFLVGMVLAFQAAVQLRQFGANIYVADLVGLAQTREFGPMITAILLAGRSGSAFAAEIGSMKVNEEVDALETMGLSPMRFLVVPKIIALLISLPLLTLFADLIGIAGGLFVGVASLDLTVQGYLLETRKALDLFDVFSGVLKSFAFALVIAGVGCLRGFQVRGGADSVGNAATSAVVSGIFLILLVDAIFTVIFQYV